MEVVVFAMVIVEKDSAYTILNPGKAISDSMRSPAVRANYLDLPVDKTTVL
jgi:hypothetical protein